jgi:hypothetical protein
MGKQERSRAPRCEAEQSVQKGLVALANATYREYDSPTACQKENPMRTRYPGPEGWPLTSLRDPLPRSLAVDSPKAVPTTSLHSAERAAQAEEEIDALARELNRAVGLHGRDRRAASASERARVNVNRAIKAPSRESSSRTLHSAVCLRPRFGLGHFVHTPQTRASR